MQSHDTRHAEDETAVGEGDESDSESDSDDDHSVERVAEESKPTHLLHVHSPSEAFSEFREAFPKDIAEEINKKIRKWNVDPDRNEDPYKELDTGMPIFILLF